MNDRPILSRKIRHRGYYNNEVRDYYGYPLEKCPEGLEYMHWSKYYEMEHYLLTKHLLNQPYCNDPVVWVLSDDDYVIPVMYHLTNQYYTMLKTPFGNFAKRPGKLAKMKVWLGGIPIEEDDVARGKLRNDHAHLKQVIVQLMTYGFSREEIIAQLCSNKRSRRARFIQKWSITKECKDMIKKEVKDVLSEMGIDEKKVVEMLLEAYKTALGKEDVSNMLRTTENFVDMLGMKDKNRETVSEKMELSTEHADLAKLESIERRIMLEKKVDRPVESGNEGDDYLDYSDEHSEKEE